MGLVASGAACWSGCRRTNQPQQQADGTGDRRQAPIAATVTVGMIADLVRTIGGPHVHVHQIMGAGTDPHLYKASRDDAAAILRADIVFYNGLLLEGKMSELLEQIGRKKRTVAVAERLPAEVLLSAPDAQGHMDPHVWMDVSLWNRVAEVIAEELADFDPVHADDYRAAAQPLRRELERLHQYGQAMMQCVPAAQRVLITSHDAFRYFGRAYQVEVEAVQGISTESEAGLNRINALVDLIVQRKIQAVFVESSVPRQSIEAILKGAASRGHAVVIGGTLYSDAMGPDGTYEGTYVGMMDHNISTIARHLGCDRVPADGFRGWRGEEAA
ncbi:MAG: manganese transporter [Planctomycetota bacterium]|nr:MAG: manganese transporter [Planctomycetota bacterium]